MSQKVLLGTYTRRISEGIYQIELNTQTQKVENLHLLIKETNPTYLAKSHAGKLYSITNPEGHGGIAGYTQQGEFLNNVVETGAAPCYVAVDEQRQLVYSANYHAGRFTIYAIDADGSIKETQTITHTEPTGPHKNQDSAHAHYSDLAPDQRLIVCDLGTDRVYTYDVSEEGIAEEVAVYKAEDGTGPRHLVFHPEKAIAYLFGELDSSVTVLVYDEEGHFTEKQKLSTLPDDFTGENGGAAIRISSDGRFLYASNRGHNSLAVFEISEDGLQLEHIQQISTEGDFPRDFALSPEEDFLLCANQNSDNLTLYQRDQTSGKLTMIQKDIYAPETVCVVFE